MKNTKDLIQKAVIQNMKIQDIHSIKVCQLVNTLNISRSTFYLYYDSVFDVLQDIEDTFFENLQALANNFWSYPPNIRYLQEPHPIIQKTMTFLRDNMETPKVLWGPYGDPLFKSKCKKMIRKAFFPSHIYELLDSDETTLSVAYMTGGHLELINHWIENDCSYDLEKLSLLIYRLMFSEYK
jgi:hypothetical protein